MKNLKIIFAGTPDFAATALQKLLDEQYEIIAVYTQPDRPAGRGRKLKPSPVKALALEHKIPVEQPVSFKEEGALDKLASYQPDLIIVAAYGLLLPVSVLAIPKWGCLNIHASLLPRWRGAAPIQRAILAGDKETGITIMQMDKGLDTGDMLIKHSTPIHNDDTGGSLHDRLAELGGQAIVEALKLLEQNQLNPEKQDDSQATYAKKLSKSESDIDWSRTAEEIDRQIRAFDPWPGSQTRLDEKVIRIQAAQILDSLTEDQSGCILAYGKQGIDVQCGKGQIRITRCQLPGSRAMSINDLHNGHPDLFEPGQCFS
ncbi:MAG: methionyl-tRNA formyltransferase [Thioalkalispiraceae bacterium]|jgi:methionyl-tRNA formyltransferase